MNYRPIQPIAPVRPIVPSYGGIPFQAQPQQFNTFSPSVAQMSPFQGSYGSTATMFEPQSFNQMQSFGNFGGDQLLMASPSAPVPTVVAYPGNARNQPTPLQKSPTPNVGSYRMGGSVPMQTISTPHVMNQQMPIRSNGPAPTAPSFNTMAPMKNQMMASPSAPIPSVATPFKNGGVQELLVPMQSVAAPMVSPAPMSSYSGMMSPSHSAGMATPVMQTSAPASTSHFGNRPAGTIESVQTGPALSSSSYNSGIVQGSPIPSGSTTTPAIMSSYGSGMQQQQQIQFVNSMQSGPTPMTSSYNIQVRPTENGPVENAAPTAPLASPYMSG